MNFTYLDSILDSQYETYCTYVMQISILDCETKLKFEKLICELEILFEILSAFCLDQHVLEI